MKEAKNELMQFVAGIIMLVVGLYIFSQKVIYFQAFSHSVEEDFLPV